MKKKKKGFLSSLQNSFNNLKLNCIYHILLDISIVLVFILIAAAWFLYINSQSWVVKDVYEYTTEIQARMSQQGFDQTLSDSDTSIIEDLRAQTKQLLKNIIWSLLTAFLLLTGYFVLIKQVIWSKIIKKKIDWKKYLFSFVLNLVLIMLVFSILLIPLLKSKLYLFVFLFFVLIFFMFYLQSISFHYMLKTKSLKDSLKKTFSNYFKIMKTTILGFVIVYFIAYLILNLITILIIRLEINLILSVLFGILLAAFLCCWSRNYLYIKITEEKI